MRLKNKVAIITGAASGIGQAIAEKFAQKGAKVVVADIALDNAELTVKAIQKKKHEAMAVTMDVTNEEQVELAVEKVISAYGGVDILVSNAGTQFISPLEDLPFNQWKKLLAIQLDGAFLTTRACLK